MDMDKSKGKGTLPMLWTVKVSETLFNGHEQKGRKMGLCPKPRGLSLSAQRAASF